MKAKKRSAIDCVVAAHEAAKSFKADRSWVGRLPPEGQLEMAEIKKEWVSGRLKGVSNIAVFRGIIARCKEESWQPPKSETTILRWLRSSEK